MDVEVQEEVNVRVRNGARWLDENFPGWVDRIDLETLNLSNGESCICGQVFAPHSSKTLTHLTATTTLSLICSMRLIHGLLPL